MSSSASEFDFEAGSPQPQVNRTRKADEHRRKAKKYLKEAQNPTNLYRRQEFLGLCERELQIAVAIRYDTQNFQLPKPDRRNLHPRRVRDDG
jgi:hypothetical protein